MESTAEENTDWFIRAGGVGVGLFFFHPLGPLELSV